MTHWSALWPTLGPPHDLRPGGVVPFIVHAICFSSSCCSPANPPPGGSGPPARITDSHISNPNFLPRPSGDFRNLPPYNGVAVLSTVRCLLWGRRGLGLPPAEKKRGLTWPSLAPQPLPTCPKYRQAKCTRLRLQDSCGQLCGVGAQCPSAATRWHC